MTVIYGTQSRGSDRPRADHHPDRQGLGRLPRRRPHRLRGLALQLARPGRERDGGMAGGQPLLRTANSDHRDDHRVLERRAGCSLAGGAGSLGGTRSEAVSPDTRTRTRTWAWDARRSGQMSGDAARERRLLHAPPRPPYVSRGAPGLSTSQRAMIAAEFATIHSGDNHAWRPRGEAGRFLSGKPDGSQDPSRVTNTQAAEMLHVAPASVVRAETVLSRGTPEEINAVRSGEASARTPPRPAMAGRAGLPLPRLRGRGTNRRGPVREVNVPSPRLAGNSSLDRGGSPSCGWALGYCTRPNLPPARGCQPAPPLRQRSKARRLLEDFVDLALPLPRCLAMERSSGSPRETT
jgi:hypothetical protein